MMAAKVRDCWYCGGCPDAKDHQMPRSRGGSDDPSNIVDSCKRCNSIKYAKTLEEFRELVARFNGMPTAAVIFHGEGGRSFSMMRSAFNSRGILDDSLIQRLRSAIGDVGLLTAASTLVTCTTRTASSHATKASCSAALLLHLRFDGESLDELLEKIRMTALQLQAKAER